jgi:hypothetical protein
MNIRDKVAFPLGYDKIHKGLSPQNQRLLNHPPVQKPPPAKNLAPAQAPVLAVVLLVAAIFFTSIPYLLYYIKDNLS